MKEITFEDTAKELVKQLESVFGKLAVAADCGLPTSNFESEASRLASKIKSSAELFRGLPSLYTDVKGDSVWYISELPEDLFMRFAPFAKKCKDSNMRLSKEGEFYFSQVADNVYVRINDLPRIETPKFKIKIEGDTLMAVNDKLYALLPESSQKLLGGSLNE